MTSSKNVLLAFAKEMNAWEKRCASREGECLSGEMTFERANLIAFSEYMQIYNRYCSRTRGTPRDLHWTEPPDYDPEHEEILSAKEGENGLAEIETQQHHGHRKRHLFKLALENGEWKLFQKGIVMDDGEVLNSQL
jgi:hypothetical protein